MRMAGYTSPTGGFPRQYAHFTSNCWYLFLHSWTNTEHAYAAPLFKGPGALELRIQCLATGGHQVHGQGQRHVE
jgi:hypothetical protein